MTHTNQRIPRITRRRLLLGTAASTGVACAQSSFTSATTPSGGMVGDDPDYAHRIRNPSLPTPSSTRTCGVAIVGGGVAGLSAAWRLVRAGITDITLFELADTVGGTARGGRTPDGAAADTRYPWGAHYLPVPNKETTCVIRLCREMGLIQGPEAAPQFKSLHLVHAPEDRLFYRGHWYESLYLSPGASDADIEQRERFSKIVDEYIDARGSDGRPAFALPAALSSTDPEFRALDGITAAAWMINQGLTSPRLRWYCNYAVLDDYGAPLEEVSAWSLLHYFAGRRPLHTAETDGSHYFTWPEGNGHIIDWLADLVPTTRHNHLVLRAEPNGQLLVWDNDANHAVRYRADHVVMAVPNHVASRLVPGRQRIADHAPWLVANLTLHKRPRRSPAGWNHVLYEGRSQGYIDAMHQAFQPTPGTVWTWYQPLPTRSRGLLYNGDWKSLSGLPLADLRPAYGDLRPYLERVDILRWGHGTVIPKPNLIFGDSRRRAVASSNRLHFAHTDYSGLPLFEEANFRGVMAAEAILDQIGQAYEPWSTPPSLA